MLTHPLGESERLEMILSGVVGGVLSIRVF